METEQSSHEVGSELSNWPDGLGTPSNGDQSIQRTAKFPRTTPTEPQRMDSKGKKKKKKKREKLAQTQGCQRGIAV